MSENGIAVIREKNKKFIVTNMSADLDYDKEHIVESQITKYNTKEFDDGETAVKYALKQHHEYMPYILKPLQKKDSIQTGIDEANKEM